MTKTKLYLLSAFVLLNTTSVFAQKVKLEEIKEQCSNLDYAKRVRLTVSSFEVATTKAYNQFGNELSEMLANALQNVNCFTVLLSAKNSQQNISSELAYEQSGTTNASTMVKSGNQKGAQVIVMGKVTEYAEGKSGVSALGIGVGGNKAHVGFIIQLINVETREIIESRSINVDGSSNGFQGVSLFGLNVAGSVMNKAVANACEKGIIEAVEFIASRKDKMPLPEANGGMQSKAFNATNCPLTQSGKAPKIMVILPEFHITRRLPDPAGETEIIRQFIEAGFPVVDAAMYASIQGTAQFDEAAKNPMKAIALGKQFGADVVIYGEAFSQLADAQPARPQVSCRARVEVKAVKTSDATIVAANGLEAGALDNGEFVAAKSALRSAGQLVGNYLLEQFCTKNLSFAKSATNQSTSSDKTVTEITVTNTDYSKMKPLLEVLALNGKVVDRSVANGTGTVRFEHAPSIDLAELIDSKLKAKYSITDFATGKMTLMAK